MTGNSINFPKQTKQNTSPLTNKSDDTVKSIIIELPFPLWYILRKKELYTLNKTYKMLFLGTCSEDHWPIYLNVYHLKDKNNEMSNENEMFQPHM